MPHWRDHHAARINLGVCPVVKEADLFEALEPLLRVRPELQTICRFGEQWDTPHAPEPEGWAPFHIVTAGRCRLETPDMPPRLLGAGDVVILPHGGPHAVKSLPEAGGAVRPVRLLPRRFDPIVVKTNVDNPGETELVCGRFQFALTGHNTILAALPPVIVVAAEQGGDAGRISSIIGVIQAELSDDRIGAAAIATSLAFSVMVVALRTHLAAAAPRQGVLALMARQQTARALSGMLNEPARAWTLDELADIAGTSRATLVRQFRSAVEMAPVAFLAELRLTIARGRIRAGNTSLAVIAEDVGYQSETAFSRAYQRQFGVVPSADRSDSLTVRD